MVAEISLLLVLSFANSNQGQPPNDAKATLEEIAKKADEARASDLLNEAIALYTQGVGLRPSWKEGWWWLGSLLYDEDRFPEAQAAFAKFVGLSSKPGPAYAFLALCEYENRKYDRALQHFQAWLKNGSPGNDALLDVAGYHWALLLTHEGQFDQALYLLAAKAKKLGYSPALVEAMGLASLRMANLPEDFPAAKRELVWLAGKAAIYSALEDTDRSEEFSRKIEVRYDNEPNVHYFLGTLLGFQNKFAEAAKEYKKELQISPKHVPAMIELALVLVRDLQPKEALPVAKQAAVLEPKDARARYALGKSLLDAEQFQESVRELEAAKQLAPTSAPVRSALSIAYRRVDRMQDAKREAAAFLSLKDKQETLAPLAGGSGRKDVILPEPEHPQ
jgi:tetratricopeptide (TPR) repeat protein